MVCSLGQFNMFNQGGFNLLGSSLFGYDCGMIGNNGMSLFGCGYPNMYGASQYAVANSATGAGYSLGAGLISCLGALVIGGIGAGARSIQENSYSGKTETLEDIQEQIDEKLKALGTSEDECESYSIKKDKVYTEAEGKVKKEISTASATMQSKQAGYDSYVTSQKYMDEYPLTANSTEKEKTEYKKHEAAVNANKTAYDAYVKAEEEKKTADEKLRTIQDCSEKTIAARKEKIETTKDEIAQLIEKRDNISQDLVEKASKQGNNYSVEIKEDEATGNSKESDLQRAINEFKNAENDAGRRVAQAKVLALYKDYTVTQNKNYSDKVETAYQIVKSWKDTDSKDDNLNGAYNYKFGV